MLKMERLNLAPVRFTKERVARLAARLKYAPDIARAKSKPSVDLVSQAITPVLEGKIDAPTAIKLAIGDIGQAVNDRLLDGPTAEKRPSIFSRAAIEANFVAKPDKPKKEDEGKPPIAPGNDSVIRIIAVIETNNAKIVELGAQIAGWEASKKNNELSLSTFAELLSKVQPVVDKVSEDVLREIATLEQGKTAESDSVKQATAREKGKIEHEHQAKLAELDAEYRAEIEKLNKLLGSEQQVDSFVSLFELAGKKYSADKIAAIEFYESELAKLAVKERQELAAIDQAFEQKVASNKVAVAPNQEVEKLKAEMAAGKTALAANIAALEAQISAAQQEQKTLWAENEPLDIQARALTAEYQDRLARARSSTA